MGSRSFSGEKPVIPHLAKFGSEVADLRGDVEAAFTRIEGEVDEDPLLPSYTTAERDALTPSVGAIIFNSDLAQFQGWNGTAWVQLDQNFESFAATLTPTGTTETIDWADGRNAVLDLGSATGDVTMTLSNPVAGTVYTAKVIQGGTARDLLWPPAVLWAGGTPPVISIANDAIDIIQLFFDGTNYLGQFTQAFA